LRRIVRYKRIGILFIKILTVVVMFNLMIMINISDVAGYTKQKRDAAEEMIVNLMNSLEIYRLHNGFYPTTEQGLEALIKLRIRYLRDYIKILKDNGFVDWAETVENLEGKNYLYDY